MTHRLAYATVVNRPRSAIHVVRILDGSAEIAEIEHIAEWMRQRALSRYGDQTADVVVVQGGTKESLRLFGEPHCVRQVRAAMFNAAVSWTPLDLD